MTLLAVLWSAGDGIAQTSKTTAKPEKIVEVNLDEAEAVSLPRNISETLKPVAFTTTDKKEGWVVSIPGNHPIATPAYADGMIFVGGGYGSYEFYAFDAETGVLRWKYKTDDDGPTAAVVESGCAAFNTESCTVYVLNTQDGKLLWKEWLGDPLMSQPAIHAGKLYMSYPTAGRSNQFHQNVLQNNISHAPQASPPAATPGKSHALLCADLKTGKHLWQVPITSEVITAPVIEGDEVYISCHDGTSYCIKADTGTVAWEKKNNATSAPLVAAGKVINSERQDKGKVAYENFSIIAKGSFRAAGRSMPTVVGGDDFRDGPEWKQAEGGKIVTEMRAAPFLQNSAKGVVGMTDKKFQELDTSVGFASAPAAANLGSAAGNIGIDSVAGGWAYQGSRASHIYGDEGSFAAGGAEFFSFSNNTGSRKWTAKAKGQGIDADSQIFAPPALGQKSMYLVSGNGHVLSVDKDSGKVKYMYGLKESMTFQPALANGNIYLGTNSGRLICLKTKDPDADGWTAWGGNARHNK